MDSVSVNSHVSMGRGEMSAGTHTRGNGRGEDSLAKDAPWSTE